MKKISFDFSLLQNLYLFNNNKITKLNNYVLDPKKANRFHYLSNYSNYNIEGIRIFLKDSLTNENLYFEKKTSFYNLISYYSLFFRNCLISIKKNKVSMKCLIASLLKGGYIILKYFAKKYNQNFTSIFMPDLFTNSEQFKLTEYYKYGNYDRFLLNSESSFCWYFHTYQIKDDLLFYHLMRQSLIMFSFSSDDSIIESSDFFFPYTVSDDRTLYGGLILMCIIFYDLMLFSSRNSDDLAKNIAEVGNLKKKKIKKKIKW